MEQNGMESIGACLCFMVLIFQFSMFIMEIKCYTTSFIVYYFAVLTKVSYKVVCNAIISTVWLIQIQIKPCVTCIGLWSTTVMFIIYFLIEAILAQ